MVEVFRYSGFDSEKEAREYMEKLEEELERWIKRTERILFEPFLPFGYLVHPFFISPFPTLISLPFREKTEVAKEEK